MQTIGVIGLGRMGGSMARCLLETGFRVVGYDVSDAAVATLEDAGGEGRASPASVGADAAVVVTSLPSPEAVETAIAGEDGVLAGGGGTTVLEASTSDPDTTIAIAAVAAESHVTLVDAPVSGGPGPAAEGALTFMIGAEAGSLDPLTVEVLEALSAEAHYLGDVGAGHTAKLLNNVMFVGNLLVAMEALALGAARGVDQEALFDVVASSSGTSAQFEKRVPRVLNRNFEAGFTVELTRKDLALALRTADAVDYPTILSSTIHELYTTAAARGYGEEDAAAVVKVFEEHAGVPVESAAEMDETFEGY